MISENISNVREAVTQLIKEECFARMLLYSLEVKKSYTLTLSGRKNADFYDTDEEDAAVGGNADFISWEEARDIFFQSIKGKSLPLAFKIVLLAGHELTEKILEAADTGLKASDISSLGINIYYDRNGFRVTSGTSLKIFTFDKSVEKCWDEYVKGLITGFDKKPEE